jgi:hypothetical protein
MSRSIIRNDATPKSQTPPTQSPGGASRPTQADTDGLAHDAIAKRAYEIYVESGRLQGQCEQNWQQAQQDLQSHAEASGQSQPRGDTRSYATDPNKQAARQTGRRE